MSHIAPARRLRPLRVEGVLIVGSDNIVHNLHSVTWRQPDFAFDWATRFGDPMRADRRGVIGFPAWLVTTMRYKRSSAGLVGI